MSRIAYVNGRYVPLRDARVHIEDRGYQFADGVYEVVTVQQGTLADERGHLDRLARSLAELRIDWPVSREALRLIMREVIKRNLIRDGFVYLQVTRGVAPRDFKFPKAAQPSLVLTARAASPAVAAKQEQGVSVITVPDIRWARRDIKTVALLPQVLAKQKAAEAGAYEAWMVDADGYVTEGSSSNAWIVNEQGEIITRHATSAILKGVTRNSLQAIADRLGITIIERPFTVAEAQAAREAFLSSANTLATPVIAIDGTPVGDGKPGPTVLALRRGYLEYAPTPAENQFAWDQEPGQALAS